MNLLEHSLVMDKPAPTDQYLVQVARLALAGRPQDVQGYLRKIMRGLRNAAPETATLISELLAAAPTVSSPLRDVSGSFVPVDSDSRLPLLKHEFPNASGAEPILDTPLRAKLDQVLRERADVQALERQGLAPTRSLLFVGPPGVGKTLSARWLANQLGLPLVTLDLATVMSSYLGKTGSNIRAVLDYAKSVPCVLLLDEFDAIAKRRDDDADIGELKRLVTVILQEVDDWPSSNVLVAATNHGELLDPAIWRRFDDVLQFPVPKPELSAACLRSAFGEQAQEGEAWIPILAQLWVGRSFSDLTRSVHWIRRRSTVMQSTLADAICELIRDELLGAPLQTRKSAAMLLDGEGIAERKIASLTGVARDTLRKYRRANNRGVERQHGGVGHS